MTLKNPKLLWLANLREHEKYYWDRNPEHSKSLNRQARGNSLPTVKMLQQHVSSLKHEQLE